jgi:hypothetical protein
MSEEQFTKLFKEIQHLRSDMVKRFDTQDEEIADLKSAVADLLSTEN